MHEEKPGVCHVLNMAGSLDASECWCTWDKDGRDVIEDKTNEELGEEMR